MTNKDGVDAIAFATEGVDPTTHEEGVDAITFATGGVDAVASASDGVDPTTRRGYVVDAVAFCINGGRCMS